MSRFENKNLELVEVQFSKFVEREPSMPRELARTFVKLLHETVVEAAQMPLELLQEHAPLLEKHKEHLSILLNSLAAQEGMLVGLREQVVGFNAQIAQLKASGNAEYLPKLFELLSQMTGQANFSEDTFPLMIADTEQSLEKGRQQLAEQKQKLTECLADHQRLEAMHTRAIALAEKLRPYMKKYVPHNSN